MKWKIIDSLACPKTGTFFAAASSPRNMKLILWYQSDFFLRAGHSLSTSLSGMVINGRFCKMHIIHAFPFSCQLWTDLIQRTTCPANLPDFNDSCLISTSCKFRRCPYGIRTESF